MQITFPLTFKSIFRYQLEFNHFRHERKNIRHEIFTIFRNPRKRIGIIHLGQNDWVEKKSTYRWRRSSSSRRWRSRSNCSLSRCFWRSKAIRSASQSLPLQPMTFKTPNLRVLFSGPIQKDQPTNQSINRTNEQTHFQSINQSINRWNKTHTINQSSE